VAIVAEIARALRAGSPPIEIGELETPLKNLNRLRRLAAYAPWLDGALRRYERNRPRDERETLDRVLGLAGAGKDSFWIEERRERRDAAVRELHALGRSAPEIQTLIVRRRELKSHCAPTSREDELLDLICENNPPGTVQQVRNIVRGNEIPAPHFRAVVFSCGRRRSPCPPKPWTAIASSTR